MAEPYLIAHIVRGEPAFDIAIRLMIGEEEGWIIPTSGHRARPFAEWALNELFYSPTTADPKIPITDASDSIMMKDYSNWPDHYAANNKPALSSTTKLGTADLLKDLGL